METPCDVEGKSFVEFEQWKLWCVMEIYKLKKTF